MSLPEQFAGYVDDVMKAIVDTAAGTVVTSPSHRSEDPLTVILDGSALAVPVKQLRLVPVFPGMRVGLIRIGVDWVVVGAFTNPGEGTGTMRMTVGADTPAELTAYGVEVSMLFFVTDKFTGLEVGYFFIALSNSLDAGADGKVTLFGNVRYPIAGDPSSATVAEVKTNFQMNLWGDDSPGFGFTIFKDSIVSVQASVPLWTFAPPVTHNGIVTHNGTAFFNGQVQVDNAVFLNGQVQIDDIAFIMPAATLSVQVGGNVQVAGASFILSGGTFHIEAGAGGAMHDHDIHNGESGTQLVSFTTLTSTTVPISFAGAFTAVPKVMANIESGSGSTGFWFARAINITTTGFTLWVHGPVSTWTNVPVSWVAFES